MDYNLAGSDIFLIQVHFDLIGENTMSRYATFFVLMAFILSACGEKAAPAETQSPTTSEVQTPAPAATITTEAFQTEAVATFADIPIESTQFPTNVAGCTDKATFISDVTVEDGSIFSSGTSYTKTWRIKNIGTCTWNPGYVLVFSSGEKSGAPDAVQLPYTPPNETADVSVNLTAPEKLGNINTFFEVRNSGGTAIAVDDGKYLYVSIYVTKATAAQPSATVSAGSGGTVPGSACPYTTDPAKVSEVIGAVNSYRTKNGAPALTANPNLTQAAQTHAADMACNNLFTHTGSDGSTPESRVAKSGYGASSVTENVYGSYPPLSGQGVVAWWANDQTDPRHNENLLSTTYTEVGVAYTFYNNYGYYVIVFAAP